MLAVYGIRAQPATPTATTQCSDELCECVSVALRGGVTSNRYVQIVSGFLSPTTRPQARLPAVEESQRMGAATQRAAKAEIKVEPEIITARLDTGATCHDFISQTTADALVARGANLEPTSGRVCSAFQGEEKSLSNRVNIRYGFYNHLTRTVQRIKISPVILPALRAPLIIGIQTLGKHGLLAKQLPSLCTHSTKKRRTEAPSSPEEPLTREDTVDGTTAGLKSAEVRHRTPAVPHDRYKRTG